LAVNGCQFLPAAVETENVHVLFLRLSASAVTSFPRGIAMIMAELYGFAVMIEVKGSVVVYQAPQAVSGFFFLHQDCTGTIFFE